MRFLELVVGTLLFNMPAMTSAQAFDPVSVGASVAEQPSEILVLGSPHLAEMQGPFNATWLEPILTSVARFRPAAIVTEALPGEALHGLAAYGDLYPGVAEMFGAKRLQLSQEAAGRLRTSMPAAEAQARNMLQRWPSEPNPADRRKLAALFIAAGDLNSALVQWLSIAERERVASDGIGKDAATQLQKMVSSRNEIISIAVRLAVRLGLERLWAMDDQSDSDLFFAYADAVKKAEQSPELAAARKRRLPPRFTSMSSPDTVLTAFREHNSDEAGKRDAENQWLARLESGAHAETHRSRIGAWEARNLRMAANIREVSARYPSRPILVLVGSSHKPYLEAYLRMMSDIRLVRASEVLGGRDQL